METKQIYKMVVEADLNALQQFMTWLEFAGDGSLQEDDYLKVVSIEEQG